MIVEQTAISIEPEADDALHELLTHVRREIEEIRDGRAGSGALRRARD
jgi:hypothetical protein